MADAPVPVVASAIPEPARVADGGRRELAAVVVAVAVGGAIGVLATARAWSTVVVTRVAPLGPVRHDVTGRTLQPGVTGLAVVALAGVLAVLATRGVTRRAIGAVLVLAGAGMLWWSVAGLSAVSAARGRHLVADARTVAGLGSATATDVVVHPLWVVLAALGGVLVTASGVTTVLRGGRWRAMSARYESPVGAAAAAGRAIHPPGAIGGAGDPRGYGDPEAGAAARARADLALWHQLDRGEDPTVSPPTAEYPTRDGSAGDRSAGDDPAKDGSAKGGPAGDQLSEVEPARGEPELADPAAASGHADNSRRNVSPANTEDGHR